LDGVIDSKVLVVEPNRQLSYTWDALGLKSVVVWTLTPTKTGTLVRMEHSGAYKGANYGWQKFIGQLEQVLARIG